MRTALARSLVGLNTTSAQRVTSALMSNLTEKLATELDDCIIENFADIYELEDALKRIEKKHALDDERVIAAIATCADVAAAQERLVGRPPRALADGLTKALHQRKLRPTAELLTRALLAGALLELEGAGPTPKKLPSFARPSRLPPPRTSKKQRASAAEVEALVRALVVATPDAPPEPSYTAESLAAFGRALALGWLSHGAEPKHAWAAFAAAYFPDEATTRELGMMARELGPRVGQFKKAVILVDVLAATKTRAALEVLNDLATKVKTASVRDRARAAFEIAAKTMRLSPRTLADRVMPEDAPVGKELVRRLEERMITAEEMSAVDFVENILQREAVRRASVGVVFAARRGKKLATFTIARKKAGALVDVAGEPFELAEEASVLVVHPLSLTKAERAKWLARIDAPAFGQLDRKTYAFSDVASLARAYGKRLRDAGSLPEGRLRGLEARGWKREVGQGGVITTLSRELEGLGAVITLDPGIYAGRGMAQPQRVTKVVGRGRGCARAISELARELETLVR